MDYSYNEIIYKARKHKENDYSYTKKEECVKANAICEYINEKYPILDKVLVKKGVPGGPTDKIRHEIFLASLLYFCRLVEKNISDEFKSLIDAEVEIVNEILKAESNWKYLSNCNFFNKGNYNVTMIDYDLNIKKCTGSFSEIEFSNYSYRMVNDENINIEETTRFYNTYYYQLEKLKSVLIRKKEILDAAYSYENTQNNMDMEVLKVLASELGANSRYCAYDFLVKHNKKNIVSSIKDKIMIKK